MPNRHTERASEAAWEQEHSDEFLEHLPASFRVLAKFALQEKQEDAKGA